MKSKKDFFLLFSFFLYDMYTRMRAKELPTTPVTIMDIGNPTDTFPPALVLFSQTWMEALVHPVALAVIFAASGLSTAILEGTIILNAASISPEYEQHLL